jgi:hypothetical protein
MNRKRISCIVWFSNTPVACQDKICKASVNLEEISRTAIPSKGHDASSDWLKDFPKKLDGDSRCHPRKYSQEKKLPGNLAKRSEEVPCEENKVW